MQVVVLVPAYLLTGTIAGLVVERIHARISSMLRAAILGVVLTVPLGLVTYRLFYPSLPFYTGDFWFMVIGFALVFGGSVASGIYYYSVVKPDEPEE